MLGSNKESKHTREFCRLCERAGAMTYPLVGHKRAPKGWPDRMIIFPEGPGYFEFKENKRWLDKAQEQILNGLIERQCRAGVIHFMTDVTGEIISYSLLTPDRVKVYSTNEVVKFVRFLRTFVKN